MAARPGTTTIELHPVCTSLSLAVQRLPLEHGDVLPDASEWDANTMREMLPAYVEDFLVQCEGGSGVPGVCMGYSTVSGLGHALMAWNEIAPDVIDAIRAEIILPDGRPHGHDPPPAPPGAWRRRLRFIRHRPSPALWHTLVAWKRR